MNKDLAIVIVFLLVIGVLFFTRASSLNFNIVNGGDPFLSPKFKVEEQSGGRAGGARRTQTLQGLRERADRINIFENITRERNRRAERREVISDINNGLNPNESIYKGVISLKTTRAKESDVLKEYITISLPLRAKVKEAAITGF